MAQADATIANVATPSIHAGLHASGAVLQLVVGAYLIAFAVLLITGARLGKAIGYRRVFVAGVSLFGLASLACGLAPGALWLVGARAAQGAAAAMMFPQALTGIQLTLGGPHRARAIALYSVALSAGAVTGQLVGGALISANVAGSHWRAIFLVNVPIAAPVALAARRHLPADPARVPQRMDVLGVTALSLSLLLVVIPLVLGQPDGWPTWSWVALAASAPCFVTFLALERRIVRGGGAPLVNVHVIAAPPVAWSLLTLLLAVGTYYSLLFTLAQYLQQGLGHSALVSGLTVVPLVAAFGLAGALVRRLPAHAHAQLPRYGCMLLAAAYAAITALLLTGRHPEMPLLVLMAAGGLGLGVQYTALLAHLTTTVAPEYAPDISGVSTTTVQIGAVLGVAAFGTLYFGQSHLGAAEATHAFAIVAGGLALSALGAAIAASRATRPRRRTVRAHGSTQPASAGL
jgi:MFS family permease